MTKEISQTTKINDSRVRLEFGNLLGGAFFQVIETSDCNSFTQSAILQRIGTSQDSKNTYSWSDGKTGFTDHAQKCIVLEAEIILQYARQSGKGK